MNAGSSGSATPAAGAEAGTPTPPAAPPVLLEDLQVGQRIAHRTIDVDRRALVRYAGASGDLNPIHYDDAFAASVGLDGVIAHGMLTMGTAIEAVSAWIGDPGAIREYSTRFTRPVPVPGAGSATLEVAASIGAVDAEAGTVRVDLDVTCGGVKVLGRARATVAVPSRGGSA